jgi:hypothetical protein
MAGDKKKILVICDYYLPGFKSGGGMRTIVNMVDRLSDRYDFNIITRDHDGRLDKSPYRTVKIGSWNDVGTASVYYLAMDEIKTTAIERLVNEVKPDAIYLNSFFATPANYLLFLRLRGRVKTPVIMAPCGELITAAMQFKSAKKKAHILFTKLAGLHKGVFWKATTELEKRDIEKRLGPKEKMFVAADMPPKAIFPEYEQTLKPKKMAGELKLVFLARFVRTKNFGFLADRLAGMSGKDPKTPGKYCGELYWRDRQSAGAEKTFRISLSRVAVAQRKFRPYFPRSAFCRLPSDHQRPDAVAKPPREGDRLGSAAGKTRRLA